jgi:LPXTG-motif cell wall-anchored protein
MHRVTGFVFLGLTALAMAPAALAQGVQNDGYNEGGSVLGTGGGSAGSGALPFTGFDVLFVVIAGLALVAGGLLLRGRRSRSAE